MPITPLPQFEADLAEQDREIYERLKPPSSVVVRFGIMRMVGEFPYSGDAKPGCGSKLVVKTHRGTELGEMLTSTCPNSGCSKSVSRQEMLQYIEASGGREYPFFSMQGRVLRIATAEDLNEQARIDASRPGLTRSAREIAQRLNMTNMKICDSEPILGGEKLTFYFTSEDRVDFRELVDELAKLHHNRIEMRQVGARDEARLVADYERCGQHCCCKQFLKVLKPVSMKSAKIQKATLDPLKISGRCGRLMCCLRYEDETYDQLRARLPRKKSRVKTSDGWGTVLDGQILTQLVLVQLDSTYEQVAIAVEELELASPENPAPPVPPPPEMREPAAGSGGGAGGSSRSAGPGGGPRPGGPPSGDRRAPGPSAAQAASPGPSGSAPGAPSRAPGPDRSSDRRRDGGGQRAAGGPPSQREPRPGSPPRPPRPDQPHQQRPPAPRPAPSDDDIIDLDDIETDIGDGPRPSRGSESGGGGGGGGGGGRKRRRRRRGGGGGGGGAGGGGSGGGGGGGSPPPGPGSA